MLRSTSYGGRLGASLRFTGLRRGPRASSVQSLRYMPRPASLPRSAARSVLCSSQNVNRHPRTAHNLRCATKLGERAFLDLTNTLGADAEPLPDLGELLGRQLESEARLYDLPLTFSQPRQKRSELLAGYCVDNVLVGGSRKRILKQVSHCPKLALCVLDRLVQTAWTSVSGEKRLRLVELDVCPVGQLADLGRAALALVDALVFGFELRELAKSFRR